MSKKRLLHRLMRWWLAGPYLGFRTERSFWVRAFPELAKFESPAARFRAFGKAQRLPWAWNILLIVAGILVGYTAITVWPDFIATLVTTRGWLKSSLDFLPLFLFCAAAPLLGHWLFRSRIRQALRQQLSDLGHPICVPCGYDLTGNASGRCPECGVSVPEPKRSMPKKSALHRLPLWVFAGFYSGFRTERSFWVRAFPELAKIESPAARLMAFGKAQRVLRPWNIFLFAVWLIFFTAIIVCNDAVAALLANITSFKIPLEPLPLFVLFLPLLLGLWLFRSRFRRALRRQLSDLGHPICVPCGYDLTGNVSGRCPKCGAGVPGNLRVENTTGLINRRDAGATGPLETDRE